LRGIVRSLSGIGFSSQALRSLEGRGGRVCTWFGTTLPGTAEYFSISELAPERQET
jgi:hypothetical protein